MVSISLAVTLMTVAVAPAVTVTGTTACPTRQAVATRVAALLPAADRTRALDEVSLEDAGKWLRVTLLDPEGHVIAQRLIQRSFSCADLAAAAGVVIASWESDVHPEFKLGLGPVPSAQAVDLGPGATPRTPPPSVLSPPRFMPRVVSPREPSAVRASPPEPAPSFTATTSTSPPTVPPSALPTPPAPVARAGALTSVAAQPVVTRAAIVPAEPTASGATGEVGAAFLGMLAPGDGATSPNEAWGGRITAAWTATDDSRQGWGAHIGLLGSTERQTSLSFGSARWRRWTLDLGPHRRWAAGTKGWFVDAHAGALAALLTLRGAGFATNQADTVIDFGLGIGVRTMWSGPPRRRLRPWVDLAATGWLRSHVVYEQPAGVSATLPRLEVILALGFSFAFERGPP
ncbi:MAG: hypothetical protein ABUS79_25455 [Pseudomonadota bacterium]